MCSKKSVIASILIILCTLLLTGALLLLVFGIIYASEACNTKYRDCTQQMDSVILVTIGEYKCGYSCVIPEYKFSYLEKNGYCFVISNTETFNFNQTYKAYTYDSAGISKCDMNPGRYDGSSNLGIILTCVGGGSMIIAIVTPILILKKTKIFD